MFIYLILLGICNFSLGYVANVHINIDSSNFVTFDHFWKSTGLCPPDPKDEVGDFFLGSGEKINIALIGSLPNDGIQQVRIHWLLNLLTSHVDVNGQTVYNFTGLDNFITYINDNNLYLGFELMGDNNSKVNIRKDKEFWIEISQAIAARYIEKFGAERISKWRFETWNEPDLVHFNLLNFTLPEFLGYATGCKEGLKAAFETTNYTYNLGGPGGMFQNLEKHPLCWGLLDYCVNVTRDECPLQFISFHRKGGGTAHGLLNKTIDMLDEFNIKYPSLIDIPISNDESDIETAWSNSREWRGDVRYAQKIVEVIAGFHKSVSVERKLKIEVMSFDNGFLNYHPFYFTQRTLFARFQINTTTPHHEQFVKKPVYSLMGLLSFLGNEILEDTSSTTNPLLTIITTRSTNSVEMTSPDTDNSHLEIVTIDGDGDGGPSYMADDNTSFVSIIVGYGDEDVIDNSTDYLNLNVSGLETGSWKYTVYRLDNIHTNPYDVWNQLGSPVFPSKEQRQQMRDVEEPQRLFSPLDINDTFVVANINLTMPSVHLVHICNQPEEVPEQINLLQIHNITWNEILLTWKYNSETSKCILTYEVEFQSECQRDAEFVRINLADTMFGSFQYITSSKDSTWDCEGTLGNYRVRAVDYWNRPGEYSELVHYP